MPNCSAQNAVFVFREILQSDVYFLSFFHFPRTGDRKQGFADDWNFSVGNDCKYRTAGCYVLVFDPIACKCDFSVDWGFQDIVQFPILNSRFQLRNERLKLRLQAVQFFRPLFFHIQQRFFHYSTARATNVVKFHRRICIEG